MAALLLPLQLPSWQIFSIWLLLLLLPSTRVMSILSPQLLKDYLGHGAAGITLRPYGNEQQLCSTRRFEKGEVILEVPASLCLFAHRSGAIRGLEGQTEVMWEECGDLREPLTDDQVATGRTWDIQLSLALLEACMGQGLAGPFWDDYAHELPLPEYVTLPLCISHDTILTHLQNFSMHKAARAQQQRLGGISRLFMDPHRHPITSQALERMMMGKKKKKEKEEEKATTPMIGSVVIPSPLQWAFAMVRSRCFKAADDW